MGDSPEADTHVNRNSWRTPTVTTMNSLSIQIDRRNGWHRLWISSEPVHKKWNDFHAVRPAPVAVLGKFGLDPVNGLERIFARPHMK